MAEDATVPRPPFRRVSDEAEPWVAEFRPSPPARLVAVLAVAATYVYFLIFAQFGFLRIVQEAVGASGPLLKPIMAAMVAGGIAGSVAMAWKFDRRRAQPRLIAAFAVCGAAALLTLAGHKPVLLLPVALLTGVGVGGATVGVAAVLRSVLGGSCLGSCVGWGTGLAYGFCNLPGVFDASTTGQVVVAIGAACTGMLAVQGLAPRVPEQQNQGYDYTPAGRAAWTLVFLALVWLDSAAFYVIQHTEELRHALWGPGRLHVNAAVHVGAAVLTGYALDRRWVGRMALAGALLLLAGGELIGPGHRAFGFGAWLYTAGVSVYSTVLVFYPARGARPWIAVLVYIVAGWIGSGLGIGMAENLHELPRWFLLAAGTAIAGALAGRAIGRRRANRLVVALAVVWGCGQAVPEARARDAPALAARGRAVYIREGCMACHSQFVRPVAADIERWGPARTLEETLAGTPPLLGYRRQGPDLRNVASRRTNEWNRLHLIAPRDLTPGSRMPSYAQLFAGGSGDGDALLAYLDTLGADAGSERWERAQHWRPGPRTRAILPDEQARLFGQWCASCHGAGGRGDGPLASRLLQRPRDLVAEPWRFAPAEVDETLALARIVKFGAPGTAMAGREYLPDDEIAALALYVRALRRAGRMNGN